MKKIAILFAMLLLSTSATAAIKINAQQARNMDDVQSLGVVYINHNHAQNDKASIALDWRVPGMRIEQAAGDLSEMKPFSG